jgi:hypothetical protein
MPIGIGIGVGLPFEGVTGSGVPATALLDETGAALLDETGAYILDEN